MAFCGLLFMFVCLVYWSGLRLVGFAVGWCIRLCCVCLARFLAGCFAVTLI